MNPPRASRPNQHDEGGAGGRHRTVSGTEQPTSLADAHELVRRQRPAPDAEPLVWVAYHRRNAEIYALVALIDIGERREAQAHAGQEMRFARAIEDELEEMNGRSEVDEQASSE